MAAVRLRDRDAIVTEEGLIFRVFGYSHPPNAYICDAEYAPESIFKSENPRAFRNKGENVFYKFYEDEGWRFIHSHFPQYTIFHEILGKRVVGVNSKDIAESRKPEKKLKSLMNLGPKDELVSALQRVLDVTTQRSSLQIADFGVFGSILHGFHHPKFSDIDLITYGRRSVNKLHQTLQELYADGSSALTNEFETDESVRQKNWRFQNYSPQEYVAHQRRKMIYAEFYDRKSSRKIKTEFEPVKAWNEISNEHDSQTKIVPKDWVSITARVTEDQDAPFIPSVYQIEPLKVLDGTTVAIEARRIVSFVEEFRMQAKMDETVHIEGNLEEVTTAKESFLQIALTYCPRYYEQVLKVVH